MSGSHNTVDQLLGHSNGPSDPIPDRTIRRARSSAYIVHGNFDRLARMCDDIETDGCVVVPRETGQTDTENEIYRRVHNYVASVYSYNEQVRSIIDARVPDNIDKGYFLPSRNQRGIPEYVRRGMFLWGLRNDLQHGDYWCLSVQQEAVRGDDSYYHLHFEKEDFEATPTGKLNDSGEYLAHAPDRDQAYPLPYIGDFHRRLFTDFETAFESWCARNRT